MNDERDQGSNKREKISFTFEDSYTNLQLYKFLVDRTNT